MAIKFLSTVAVDTNVLYVNAANNRVGIGTTSPQSGFKLDVNGNVITRGSAYVLNGLIHYGSSDFNIKADDGSTNIKFQAGSSERMRINANGNVGIGTTSPQKKLDVYLGTNDAVASIGGTISSGEYAGLHFGYSEAGNSLYRHSAIVFERDDGSFGDARGKIHILNSPSGSASADLGDSRLTILPTGNVGIGTTSPTTKFQVSGKSFFTDDIFTLQNKGIFFNGLSNFTSGISGTNSGTGLRLFAGGAQKVTVLSNGNVGIGTTSPDKKLDLTVSTSDDGIVLQTSTGRKALELLVDNGANGRGVVNFYTGTSLLYGRINASTEGLVIDTIANRHMIFNKAGVEVMRINTSGNVGIGTTAPGYKFEVNSGNANNVAKFVSTDGGGTITVADSGGEVGFSNIGNNIYFKTSSSQTNQMSIMNSGRVGIGTTSPDTLLNLEGVKNKSIITLGSTTNDSGWSVGDKIGGIDFYSADGSGAGSGVKGSISYIASTAGSGGVTAMTFSTASSASNNVERMRIDTSGNVGIGTTSPDSKLDVSDTSPIITINATAISAHGIEFKQSNTLDAFIKQTPSSGEFAFNVGRNAGWGGNFKFSTDTYDSYRIQKDLHRFYILGSEKMRIHTNGNVGIGETNPILGKLQVGGIIHVNRSGSNGTSANPIFENILQSGINLTNLSSVQLGNSFGSDNGTFLRFQVNSTAAASTPLNILTLKGTGGATLGTYTGTNQTGTPTYLLGTDASGNVVKTNTIPGSGAGPYLPLTAGSGSPLSGNIHFSQTNSYIFGGDNEILAGQDASGYYLATGNGQNLTKPVFIGDNNASIRFSAGNSEKMRINANGNVGIGTTSPSTKLDVAGITRISESGNTAFYGGNYLRVFNSQVYTMRNSAGNQRFAFDNGSGGFSTYNSSNVRTSYLNNSGSSYLNGGNVGIGTTSPAHKLTVNAPNNTTAVGIDFPSAHFDFSANSTSGYTTSFHMDDTATTIGSNSAGRALIFQTNNIDRFYINGNTGNVGIGTTSPSFKLDVNGGDARIANGSTATLYMNNANNYLYGDVNGVGIIGAGDNFRIKTNAAERMRITSAGNVGIGTTSPGEKLEVIGTIKANSVKVVASTTTTELTTDQYVPIKVVNTGGYAHARINGIEVGGNTSASDEGYIKTQDNSRKLLLDTNGWKFSRTNTEFMRLTSDGKLGIGTTSPTEKLHVVGNIRTNSTQGYYGSFLQAISSTGLKIGNDDFSGYAFFSDNSNIGIGTTSPSQKLEVNGEVLSDGYRLAAMQTAPAARNSTGTLGEIIIDGNHLYVCYATNSWSRVALATAW